MNRLAVVVLTTTLAGGCAWLYPAAGPPIPDSAWQPAPAPAMPVQEADLGDSLFKAEQALGLEGDAEAAYRVAQMFRHGHHGVPRDERRMIQWLHHASELEHGAASSLLRSGERRRSSGFR